MIRNRCYYDKDVVSMSVLRSSDFRVLDYVGEHVRQRKPGCPHLLRNKAGIRHAGSGIHFQDMRNPVFRDYVIDTDQALTIQGIVITRCTSLYVGSQCRVQTCRGDFFGLSVVFCIEIEKFVFGNHFGKRQHDGFVLGLIYAARYLGPFQERFDYHLVALGDSGALDGLGESRATLRANSYRALQYATLFVGESGMECLLDLHIAPPSLDRRESDPRIDFDAEEDALGMIVSSSPFLPYEEDIEGSGALPLAEGLLKGRSKVYCLLESAKAIVTKRGKKMAFLAVHDETIHAEGICFEDTYNRCYPFLKKGNALLLTIEKDRRSEGKFIVDDVRPLREKGE